MTQEPNQPGNEPGNEPSPGPRKVRCIVPGHNPLTGKATLRAVTLPDNIKGDNPIVAKAAAIVQNAADDFRPSMVAKNAILPSDMPELFEELWEALTLTPEDKTVEVAVYTVHGIAGDVDVDNLPSGWTFTYDIQEDEKAAMEDDEQRESIEALDGNYDDRFEYDDDFAVDRS